MSGKCEHKEFKLKPDYNDAICCRCEFIIHNALDICDCGDYRYQHSNEGKDKCRMPDDGTHGFKPCLKFRLSMRKPAAERGGKL